MSSGTNGTIAKKKKKKKKRKGVNIYIVGTTTNIR